MKNKYVEKLVDLKNITDSENKTLQKILDVLNNVKGFEGYRWTGGGNEKCSIARSSFDRNLSPSSVKKNLPLWLRGTNIIDGIYVTLHVWEDWYGDYYYPKAYIKLQTREDYIDDLDLDEKFVIRKRLGNALLELIDFYDSKVYRSFPFFKYNAKNYKQIWYDLINVIHSYIKEEEFQRYMNGEVITQQRAEYLEKRHKEIFLNMEKRHNEIDEFFKNFFSRPYPKKWKNYTLYSLKNSH